MLKYYKTVASASFWHAVPIEDRLRGFSPFPPFVVSLQLLVKLAANVVGFFGGSGRGANRDIVGIGLLNGNTGELGAVLTDDFYFEVSEGLDFFQ